MWQKNKLFLIAFSSPVLKLLLQEILLTFFLVRWRQTELSLAISEQWDVIGFIPSKPQPSDFFNVIYQECISGNINEGIRAQSKSSGQPFASVTNVMSGGGICVLHTNIRVTCRCYIKLGWQGISSSFIILEAISVTLRGGFLAAHPFVFVQCSLSPSILSHIFSRCSEKLFPSTLHDYCPFVLLNLALSVFSFVCNSRLLQLSRSSRGF